MITEQEANERLAACADLIGHTGAKAFEVRFSEPEADDNVPHIVWLCIASFGEKFETAAGRDPLEAAERLLESLLDGGTCTHCHRSSAVQHELEGLAQVVDKSICWYQYDPELKKYRRSCE